ncbi:hypothetical protein PR048_031699 [Dryococelus australis]|uniref:Uncharacterized protein n=1 Tax=Dryococelus australis TaxID=614101 RepID=A0ABQ9G609_9NEOP|nr:hypothetical protein PR048_031699 [Dryococelus australis]
MRTFPALKLYTPPVMDNLSTKYIVIASDSVGAEQAPTVSMEQRRNEKRGKRDIPKKKTPTNGIVRHNSHMRGSGVTRPGIEPGSPWREASRLTAQPPRPPWVRAGMKGRGDGRSPRRRAHQRHRPARIPPGIEPGSPWREASVLIAQPPWPLSKIKSQGLTVDVLWLPSWPPADRNDRAGTAPALRAGCRWPQLPIILLLAAGMQERWKWEILLENPPTSDIIQHDSHLRKSGVTQPGIESGSPWLKASSLTAQPPRPRPQQGMLSLPGVNTNLSCLVSITLAPNEALFSSPIFF